MQSHEIMRFGLAAQERRRTDEKLEDKRRSDNRIEHLVCEG